jgi:hypothetical protein
VVRVSIRVVAWVALVLSAALTTALLAHASAAEADPPPFVAVGHNPTQGTPVPGAFLTADLGIWTSPPESYEFQWLRDGVPIPGATTQDYLIPATDIGHQLQPHVTGHSGASKADFLGTSMVVRKLTASLRLDVRRVHPAPTKHRLVWTAISFMSTERPATTDGGMVTAYRRKHGHWKELGSAVLTRGGAFVRLPWKRAPHGRTKVKVCYQGSDLVAVSCSRPDLVRRTR